MKFHLALIIALLLVISGCAKTGPSCASPSIPLQNGCCLDINRNGVCDRAESDVVAEETAEAQFNPVEETPAESAESKAPAKPSSPLAPTSTATARPIIGTRGEETLDTSGWESIRLYY
ncbi:MAG TPA: hypothetical protein HA362_03680, partial [Nanoarchaeota archaeon]|nr:hypothetical protein [Nanoarchaeota archaeon]